MDSVNILCSAKMQAHPENTVGLLTTAGKSARILISGTQDLGKVFACMHDVQLDGYADITAGIQKAQLALKHRQNMVQRQRIVVFVSSPVQADTGTLVRLAKKLKKNSVAVDIVHVGDDTNGSNVEKLNAFIEAVNSSDNSHIIHVPAGGGVLADALMQSEIYAERDSAAAAGGSGAVGGGGDGGSGAEGFEFGVDPAVDPELAMVLRISMEEERARQEAANRDAATDTSTGAGSSQDASGNNSAPKDTPLGGNEQDSYDDDADLYGTESAAAGAAAMDVDSAEADEAMLREAIALSQAGAEASGSTAAVEEEDDEEMDEEMRRAIELSKSDFDEETKDSEQKP